MFMIGGRSTLKGAMENGLQPKRKDFSITTGASRFENSIPTSQASLKETSDHATSKIDSKKSKNHTLIIIINQYSILIIIVTTNYH